MAVKKATAATGETGAAQATEQTAAPVKKKAGGKTAGFCVYIGPNITGVIQSGTVYPGTREQALKTIAAAVEARPLIASLVVDGLTHPTDRIKVKTPGNLLYVNYRKLASGESK